MSGFGEKGKVGSPLGIRGGGKGKEKTFNLFPKPNAELKMLYPSSIGSIELSSIALFPKPLRRYGDAWGELP
ncbi:hypothetical protein FACHB389_01370 [Nostoc calcicola FACHB-389]|nr:hypothetical protein FACHB389_01370 [Nostoc calcicola FACHB-389]